MQYRFRVRVRVATRVSLVSLSMQGTMEPPTSLGALLSFEEVLQRRWLQHCWGNEACFSFLYLPP